MPATTRPRQTFKAETGIPVYKWDVADFEACKARASPQVEAELGPVDVLVNNAGITRDAHVPPHDAASSGSEVISTNLDGLFNMTQPVWAGMRARKFGRIINIRSINGQKGQFGQANYAAAKAGDDRLHQGAGAGRCARTASRSTRSARAISTPRWSRPCREKVLKSKILPQIPVGRLGEPEEIARCVVFLASDEAGFITGSTLSANGGQYMA